MQHHLAELCRGCSSSLSLLTSTSHRPNKLRLLSTVSEGMWRIRSHCGVELPLRIEEPHLQLLVHVLICTSNVGPGESASGLLHLIQLQHHSSLEGLINLSSSQLAHLEVVLEGIPSRIVSFLSHAHFISQGVGHDSWRSIPPMA